MFPHLASVLEFQAFLRLVSVLDSLDSLHPIQVPSVLLPLSGCPP